MHSMSTLGREKPESRKLRQGTKLGFCSAPDDYCPVEASVLNCDQKARRSRGT
jgi:hypothetical protein